MLAAYVGPPLLRFRTILRCVSSGLIRIVVWIEADDVDCRRVEHGDLNDPIAPRYVARPLHTKCANLIQTGPQSQVDIQIMRDYPLVVRRQSASERHAASVLAIDLVPARMCENAVDYSALIKLQGTVALAKERKICTSICLRRPNGYRNEAARHSIICLRRLSSNRAACRRDSSSIESTPFCRAPLFARSPRRRRPNLRPKYRHGAFRRRGELPRRVDTLSLLVRLPWPGVVLVGPVAFVCARIRPPVAERALAPSTLSIWHSASSSSSSIAHENEECRVVGLPS